MTNYSFFIIIDTNDPSSFHIEMTKMNYRLRFSALKSNHIRKYGENKPVQIHTHTHSMCKCVNCHIQCDSLPGYHKILRSNYTFYLLDKLNVTAEQANEHKMNLIEEFKNDIKCHRASASYSDKFRMTFSF